MAAAPITRTLHDLAGNVSTTTAGTMHTMLRRLARCPCARWSKPPHRVTTDPSTPTVHKGSRKAARSATATAKPSATIITGARTSDADRSDVRPRPARTEPRTGTPGRASIDEKGACPTMRVCQM
jgi:hypothetical protein